MLYAQRLVSILLQKVVAIKSKIVLSSEVADTTQLKPIVTLTVSASYRHLNVSVTTVLLPMGWAVFSVGLSESRINLRLPSQLSLKY